MKSYAVAFMIILIGLLFFPQQSKQLASNGLILWFQNMIPSLFPFMILSQMILSVDDSMQLLKPLRPVTKLLFRQDRTSDYVVLIGFLCGFPLGAYMAFELYHKKKISNRQLSYLLAFCNNLGPVYLCSCVLPHYTPKLHIPILIGMYGIPLVYGMILRCTSYKTSYTYPTRLTCAQRDETTNMSLLDAFEAGTNRAIESIIKLGAYMVIFNALLLFPSILLHNLPIAKAATFCLFEINSGMQQVIELNPPLSVIFLPFLHIGGLSCLVQTISLKKEAPFHIGSYLLHKSIQAVLMFLLLLFLSF